MLAPQINPKMKVTVGKKAKRPGDVLSLDEATVEDIREQRMHLTKRRVLAFQMGQFDPLGHMGPITVKGKLLLQQLTLDSQAKGWDDPLSSEHAAKWADYITQMLNLPPVEYPRSFFPVGDKAPWLITFCDASQLAMGAATYLRWEHPQDGVQVCLVMAKT